MGVCPAYPVSFLLSFTVASHRLLVKGKGSKSLYQRMGKCDTLMFGTKQRLGISTKIHWFRIHFRRCRLAPKIFPIQWSLVVNKNPHSIHLRKHHI